MKAQNQRSKRNSVIGKHGEFMFFDVIHKESDDQISHHKRDERAESQHQILLHAEHALALNQL